MHEQELHAEAVAATREIFTSEYAEEHLAHYLTGVYNDCPACTLGVISAVKLRKVTCEACISDFVTSIEPLIVRITADGHLMFRGLNKPGVVCNVSGEEFEPLCPCEECVQSMVEIMLGRNSPT